MVTIVWNASVIRIVPREGRATRQRMCVKSDVKSRVAERVVRRSRCVPAMSEDVWTLQDVRVMRIAGVMRIARSVRLRILL